MLLKVRGTLMDLSHPRVMGIINVTPDSFYSGSRYPSEKDLIKAAGKMIEEGVDIIDIGGCSTRPGAEEVPPEEEKRRVCNAIRAVRKEYPDVPVSVDTYRASVASEAVCNEGADIINDISGGEMDNEMFPLVTGKKIPFIMMHMLGTPKTMQQNPHYDDVVAEILVWFGRKISALKQEGVTDIILDPGFGFGKTIENNFEILRRLKEFHAAGLPLLVGVSRKSMIYKTLQITPDEALIGTAALNMAALINGASILRVHDVKEARQVVSLFEKISQPVTLFDQYC